MAGTSDSVKSNSSLSKNDFSSFARRETFFVQRVVSSAESWPSTAWGLSSTGLNTFHRFPENSIEEAAV